MVSRERKALRMVKAKLFQNPVRWPEAAGCASRDFSSAAVRLELICSVFFKRRMRRAKSGPAAAKRIMGKAARVSCVCAMALRGLPSTHICACACR